MASGMSASIKSIRENLVKSVEGQPADVASELELSALWKAIEQLAAAIDNAPAKSDREIGEIAKRSINDQLRGLL